MKRGTIVLAKFPFTDLSSFKLRPALIVSDGMSAEGDVIIAFISSVIPSKPGITDYLITSRHKDFANTGLKKDSIFKLDKLATVHNSIISGSMGFASTSLLQSIDICLKGALGL